MSFRREPTIWDFVVNKQFEKRVPLTFLIGKSNTSFLESHNHFQDLIIKRGPTKPDDQICIGGVQKCFLPFQIFFSNQ